MSASVIEQLLVQVKATLVGATSAGNRVFRGRDDALSAAEMPAINIRRGGSNHDAQGDVGQRIVASWTLEHFAQGADWETAADALHMESHAALSGSSALAALGRGLRCVETDVQAESADVLAGKLTARYQMQVFVRPGDLARAVN